VVDDGAPIVVGVDGSAESLRAARWAGGLAERFDVPLHILTATPYLGHSPSDVALAARVAAISEHREWADRYLDAARSAVLGDHPHVPVTVASLDEPVDAALDTASKSARLLVLGCDDVTALGALLVGSTTLATLAHAACPVVAWRGDTVKPSRKVIVVGVDGSGRDGGALGVAFTLADRLEVPLRVVHSWALKGFTQIHRPIAVEWDENTKGQWRRLNELLDPWRDRYPRVEITRIGEAAKASRALVLQSVGAQLVVLGYRRRPPLGHPPLGSTSMNLLHHSAIPVTLCAFDEDAEETTALAQETSSSSNG
jgi:nucleotide-binding universal stress UspA family protein